MTAEGARCRILKHRDSSGLLGTARAQEPLRTAGFTFFTQSVSAQRDGSLAVETKEARQSTPTRFGWFRRRLQFPIALRSLPQQIKTVWGLRVLSVKKKMK